MEVNHQGPLMSFIGGYETGAFCLTCSCRIINFNEIGFRLFGFRRHIFAKNNKK